MTINQLLNELVSMTGLELVAALLALAYVWLAARQNSWCWACAFVSAALYTVIFWKVSLAYQAILNLYYVVMAMYGWLQWRRNNEDAGQLSITRWSLKTHIVVICCLFVVSIALANVTKTTDDITYLMYLDTLVAVFSIFTTYLVTKKVLENWLYWLIINLAACYLYANQGLYLTTLLFIVYVGMSVYGLALWARSHKQGYENSYEAAR